MHKPVHNNSVRSTGTRLLMLAALGVLWNAYALSQQLGQVKDPFSTTDRKGSLSVPDIFQYVPELKRKEATQIGAKEFPLDGPVNPAEYYVGPGDVLSLNIWSSSPVQQELTVTPEGTLLIPSVGSVAARDLTLEALKTNVTELAKRKYPRSEVTLTLISPRKVSVQIVGDVFNEGTYEMYSVQRASDLILKANELIPGQTVKDYYERTLPKLRQEASERNILIKHVDGTQTRADLVKYRITHEGRHNGYLREGDIVYVPQRKDPRNSIAVYGGANKFGSFEFVPGDSLKDLLMMGYGFKVSADSAHARFSRLSSDGAHMETTVVDATALMQGRVPNVPLAPGDRIFIPESRDNRSNYYVAVEGEVVQPGHYPITKDATRLSDVIRGAGGFTQDAFVPGAMLIRSGGSQTELEDKLVQEQLLSSRSSSAVQDSSYYLMETALRAKGDRVSVDFHRLFVLGDSTQDVVLQAFDRVSVPARQGTVFVFGQVGSPGRVSLVDGKGYEYYVEKAGGYTDEARKGDLKIIKSSTRTWLSPDDTTLEDGDYIWVPKEPYHPFSYYVTTYTQIASILGVVATVALLIVTIRK